ncbi:hypothetical protein SERLADRAFT_387982 [Serpula lacrymans var. lacrymans S7.9]|uniref:Uncharacterized protein n=1 Tax=Serpula lacrymans var. lacrymans (strain S7.9) TaxID=578457 RepID=F8NTI7_SERL9|nr:uncharacterized protein SERLADRAFT_387982 [Serpula lacrymans var. lacrymans S7.9]EGO25659.1 hypothetical protein SERLADRAFT_387982 [Serpula lacrymans var. lacrymans S7.9]
MPYGTDLSCEHLTYYTIRHHSTAEYSSMNDHGMSSTKTYASLHSIARAVGDSALTCVFELL